MPPSTESGPESGKEPRRDIASAFQRAMFRPAALARRGQTEDLDRMLRVTAPLEWAVLTILAVALVLVLIWGIFGRIERTVTAQCALAESGELHPVLVHSEGSVAEVLTAVGEEVREGDRLARLAFPQLEAQLAAARAQIAVLEADPRPNDASVSLARTELVALEAVLESNLYIHSPSSGTVVWIDLTPTALVVPGDEVAGVRAGTGDTQAFAFVAPDVAARLSPGMKALVQPLGAQGDDSDDDPHHAVVSEVSPVQPDPPTWLSQAGGVLAPSPGVMVMMDFDEPLPPVAEGAPCRARITVGQDRPVGLIAFAEPRGRG